jgi:hypothetical protein
MPFNAQIKRRFWLSGDTLFIASSAVQKDTKAGTSAFVSSCRGGNRKGSLMLC